MVDDNELDSGIEEDSVTKVEFEMNADDEVNPDEVMSVAAGTSELDAEDIVKLDAIVDSDDGVS